MKKTLFYTCLTLLFISCAKEQTESPNGDSLRHFYAWKSLNYPDADSTELGTYILEEEKIGNGPMTVADGGYAIVNFTITELDGTISSYTEKTVAKQLGEYDTTYYYGSRVWTTAAESIFAGVYDAIKGMRAGGERKFLVPKWLMSYSVYSTKEEYINAESNYNHAIYHVKLEDYTKSIIDWEIAKMGAYIDEHQDVFKDMTIADSVTKGFYFKRLSPEPAPEDTVSFKADTTVYINYTGKLLNGLVFDTTIEKIAKDNGIYSSGTTYEPKEIQWGEKWSDITMESNSIIYGFARTLWEMRKGQKAVGMFYSPLGYDASDNGKSIPAYSPLIFEIELVDKPEE